jgi:asparagine synthase (glutamine-hydrolysing)
MADDIIAKDKLQPVRLDTLSYCDPTEPSGDDSIYFPKIEEKRGRAGIHIDASKYGDGAPLECPDFSVLPGSLGAGRAIEEARAAAVRNGGYRAVLSGTGGDEFLGGVPNPYAQLADLIAQFKLLTLARQLVAWSLVKRRPLLHLLWETLAEFVPPSLAQHFDKQGEIAPWIENRFARRTKIAIKQLDVDEHFGLWLPTRRSYIAGVLSIANQMSKRLPSKTALEETRYPYLDRNLIEFVLSIPATQLLRPGERRSLMRRSLRGIVPSEILSRRTKQIAARTPVIALKKNLSELKSYFETPVSSSLGYVNRDRFMERVHAAIVGSEVHIVRILKTISLEIWLRDVARRHLINVAVEAARPAKSTALEASA